MGDTGPYIAKIADKIAQQQQKHMEHLNQRMGSLTVTVEQLKHTVQLQGASMSCKVSQSSAYGQIHSIYFTVVGNRADETVSPGATVH